MGLKPDQVLAIGQTRQDQQLAKLLNTSRIIIDNTQSTIELVERINELSVSDNIQDRFISQYARYAFYELSLEAIKRQEE